MNFLNATLLAGVLAAAVPVVLHLLARQQPKRVVFPGVAFLTSRLTQQKSRLKIRRWWLLALRVLAVVTLAAVLARPHIDSAMATTWTTIGLVAIAAVGLIAMASVAFAKNLSRGLAWSLLVASILAAIGSGIAAVATLANSATPDMRVNQPLALAIVVDNSPSSAWTVSTQTLGSETTESNRYLDLAIKQANRLIERLPSGSRLSVIDRSPTPVSFSLDLTSAQTRLRQVKPLAVPVPMLDRIEAAIELVRTSDLPNRQVIVVTDLSEPTWTANAPTSIENSRLNSERLGDVRLSLLSVRDDAEDNPINRSLSLPELAESAPSAGTSIPIRVEVLASASSGGGSTATVQLQLYEIDSSLPVVRDGETVLPARRTVDRASITLNPTGGNEVVLSLPPLPLGTYHAVIELVGDDSFDWDNRRYLTVHLPQPPRSLVIGDDPNEVQVIAAAMAAPAEITDPAAPYAIETVAYRDLTAIDWQPYELLMMIDPPIRFDASEGRWIGSSEGLSSTMLDQLTEMVTGGTGLLLSLGPLTKVIGQANTSANLSATTSATISSDTGADPIGRLTPQLKRLWRVPEPGTFLRINDPSHPVVSPLTTPSTKPKWSDFRIRRYWQTDSKDWNVIATMATRDDRPTTNASDPAAILTRQFGQGRIAVTTTPLPAIGPVSRTWNDLFTSGDAWPAFMTVRGLASWLAGLEPDQTTVQVGQTVVLDGFQSAAESDGRPTVDRRENGIQNEEQSWKVYPPEQSPYPVALQSDVGSEATLTISNTSEPGTYFLRSLAKQAETPKPTDTVTGISANLPEAWSNHRRVDPEVLSNWFGGEPSDDTWSLGRDPETVSLGGGNNAASAVSLHGPLMLLAVLVFLGEQLLSNFFYSRDRRLGGVSTTQPRPLPANRLSSGAS